MQVTTQTVSVPGGTVVREIDERGKERRRFVSNGQMVEATITEIRADEGKVFRRLADGAVLSAHITLGSGDSADNYEEVPA